MQPAGQSAGVAAAQQSIPEWSLPRCTACTGCIRPAVLQVVAPAGCTSGAAGCVSAAPGVASVVCDPGVPAAAAAVEAAVDPVGSSAKGTADQSSTRAAVKPAGMLMSWHSTTLTGSASVACFLHLPHLCACHLTVRCAALKGFQSWLTLIMANAQRCVNVNMVHMLASQVQVAVLAAKVAALPAQELHICSTPVFTTAGTNSSCTSC